MDKSVKQELFFYCRLVGALTMVGLVWFLAFCYVLAAADIFRR